MEKGSNAGPRALAQSVRARLVFSWSSYAFCFPASPSLRRLTLGVPPARVASGCLSARVRVRYIAATRSQHLTGRGDLKGLTTVGKAVRCLSYVSLPARSRSHPDIGTAPAGDAFAAPEELLVCPLARAAPREQHLTLGGDLEGLTTVGTDHCAEIPLGTVEIPHYAAAVTRALDQAHRQLTLRLIFVGGLTHSPDINGLGQIRHGYSPDRNDMRDLAYARMAYVPVSQIILTKNARLLSTCGYLKKEGKA